MVNIGLKALAISLCFAQEVASIYPWLECRDVDDWADNDGSDCAWYANPPGGADAFLDDDTYYDVNGITSRCDYFGSCCGNNATGVVPNLTANKACCVCGGGIPSLCNDVDGWTDSLGRDCDWYTENGDDDGLGDDGTRCRDNEEFHANDGYTASTACCACGGGVVGTCNDYEDWKTSEGYGCKWYGLDTIRNNGGQDDLYDDATTRCWAFGNDWGLYNGENVTAMEACCVCGGGIASVDYPSFMPVPSPSDAPSRVPSKEPTNPSNQPTSSAPTKSPDDELILTLLPSVTPAEMPLSLIGGSTDPTVPMESSDHPSSTPTASPLNDDESIVSSDPSGDPSTSDDVDSGKDNSNETAPSTRVSLSLPFLVGSATLACIFFIGSII